MKQNQAETAHSCLQTRAVLLVPMETAAES